MNWELKVIVNSVDLHIPKIEVGAKLGGAALFFRPWGQSKNFLPYVYSIGDPIALAGGGKHGVGIIETEYFSVQEKKFPWVKDIGILQGKIIEINLDGTIIVTGRVDIKISMVDEHNDKTELLEKSAVKCKGMQLADTNVRDVATFIRRPITHGLSSLAR
ncbi:MAG: hypothetical protein HY308_03125 [Gammaproteobacteria bacterium]|nr:hypothetical protein [Gammaproteobacteria bacterium]